MRSDDLVSTTVLVCPMRDGNDAVELAANRKGYGVLHDDRGRRQVVWCGPRFEAHLMMKSMIVRRAGYRGRSSRAPQQYHPSLDRESASGWHNIRRHISYAALIRLRRDACALALERAQVAAIPVRSDRGFARWRRVPPYS